MREKLVKERLEDTRENASKKLKEYRIQCALLCACLWRSADNGCCAARATAWSLNCAIGAQVVLCALTTGIAAATSGRQVRPHHFPDVARF